MPDVPKKNPIGFVPPAPTLEQESKTQTDTEEVPEPPQPEPKVASETPASDPLIPDYDDIVINTANPPPVSQNTLRELNYYRNAYIFFAIVALVIAWGSSQWPEPLVDASIVVPFCLAMVITVAIGFIQNEKKRSEITSPLLLGQRYLNLELSMWRHAPYRPTWLDVVVYYECPESLLTDKFQMALQADVLRCLNIYYCRKPTATWPATSIEDVERLIKPAVAGVLQNFKIPVFRYQVTRIPWLASKTIEPEKPYSPYIGES